MWWATWVIYNGHPIKMDDLGISPFMETPIYNAK